MTEQVTPASDLTDSGVITFTDVDLTDVHLVSATGTPIGSTLGSLTAVKDSDTTGTGTGGQLTWTYTVADLAVEYLAKDQTKVESFTITLDDQNGGVITKQIDVTITGTNDRPAITVVDAIGAMTEDVGTVSQNPNTSATGISRADTGSVTFADVDLTDARRTPACADRQRDHQRRRHLHRCWATALQSALALPTTHFDSNTGTIDWSFALDDSLVRYLAKDETVTATYTITLTDDFGAANDSTTQAVTVTVTGANDAPTVTANVVAGDSAGSDLIEGNSGLTASGTLTATDVDVTDTVTASVIGAVASGPDVGSLTTADLLSYFTITPADPNAVIDATHTTGQLTWNFNSNSQAFDFLAVGENSDPDVHHPTVGRSYPDRHRQRRRDDQYHRHQRRADDHQWRRGRDWLGDRGQRAGGLGPSDGERSGP